MLLDNSLIGCLVVNMFIVESSLLRYKEGERQRERGRDGKQRKKKKNVTGYQLYPEISSAHLQNKTKPDKLTSSKNNNNNNNHSHPLTQTRNPKKDKNKK